MPRGMSHLLYFVGVRTSPSAKTIEYIIKNVCNELKLEYAVVISTNKERRYAHARYFCFWILRNTMKLKFREIASYFEHKKHPDIIRGLHKFQDLLDTEPVTNIKLHNIIFKLNV